MRVTACSSQTDFMYIIQMFTRHSVGNSPTPSTNQVRELVLSRSKINLYALKKKAKSANYCKTSFTGLPTAFTGLLLTNSAGALEK